MIELKKITLAMSIKKGFTLLSIVDQFTDPGGEAVEPESNTNFTGLYRSSNILTLLKNVLTTLCKNYM